MDNILSAAKKAWSILAAESVKAQLVGTAALQLHACRLDTPPHDVDFLCESMPTSGESMAPDPEYRDGEASRELEIDGVNVNFILAGDERAPFLSPVPVIIEGLPVAPVEYIVALKKRANRGKDRAFFAAHPELDF